MQHTRQRDARDAGLREGEKTAGRKGGREERRRPLSTVCFHLPSWRPRRRPEGGGRGAVKRGKEEGGKKEEKEGPNTI